MMQSANERYRKQGHNIELLKQDAKAKEDAVIKNEEAQAKAQDEMANATRVHSNPDVASARGATQRASEQAIDIQSVTELFSNAQKDIKEISRTANSKSVSPEDIQEARAAVNDLAQTLKLLPPLLQDLRSLGADSATIRELQREISYLQSRVNRPVQ